MANRTTTILLQAGLVAVVFVVLPYKLFELDRYFVPKELVLHVVALVAAATLIARRRTITVDLADALLALFLVWSSASALFATNHWLAQRALGVSVSSGIIFWTARRIGAAGSYRPLLIAAAVATVFAAATALAQAYGMDSDYFSANRAPGGTFGNRNFVAHVAAIGLPALVWCTVTARRSVGALLGSLGAAVLAAALVLSRSRAAWLAVAACVIVLLGPMLASRKYWRGRKVSGRLARLLLAATIGGIVAIAIPNRLNWNSDSPYLDSARGMVDYSKGSGRGRLAQYRNSLRMAVANPLLGVGPGNWPVRYVRFAPPADRSIADDGMTANPWPSSDWVAYVSERGLVAAMALLGALAALFFGAFRGWRTLRDSDAVLLKLALVGTIVATMVVSAFDVALLLAAPAFLIWSILGAASGVRRAGRQVTLSSKAWAVAAATTMLVVAAATTRSAAQTRAMVTVGQGGRTAAWVRGATWDPGSYRINLRVAELYAARGRCSAARPYARRALALFPNGPSAKRVSRKCG
jgi:O-antigen ligase